MTARILFVAMEMAWIATLALVLDALISGVSTVFLALTTLAYPTAIAVAAATRRLSTVWGRRTLKGVGLVATILSMIVLLGLTPDPPATIGAMEILRWVAGDSTVHRVIAVASIMGFCWIRGEMLAAGEIDTQVVALGFQIGLVVLLAGNAVTALQGTVVSGGLTLVGIFVVTGLTTLWIMRAGHLDSKPNDRLGVVIGIGLIMGFGGVALALANPDLVDGLWEGIVALGTAIGALISWLLSLLPEPEAGPMPMREEMAPAPAAERPPEPPLFKPMEWMRLFFSILFFGGFAVMLALMLLINLRDLLEWLRRRRRHTPGLEYDRTAHGLADTLRALWHGLVSALLSWLSRIKRRLAARSGEDPRRSRERRLYANLISHMRARGWPPRSNETPGEYARRLRDEWPGPAGDLTVLTRRFSANRYGGVSRSTHRLPRLWKKISRSLRKVRYHHDQ